MLKQSILILIISLSLLLSNVIPIHGASQLKLNKEKITLEHGQSIRLFVKNVSDDIQFSTNQPKLVQISSSGFIVAKKPGTAIITVQANGQTAYCKIKIRKPTIRLGRTKIHLKQKQNTILSCTVSSGYHPVYKSSNQKVAKVNDLGRIYARKKGHAKIAVSFDGVVKYCKVTVK